MKTVGILGLGSIGIRHANNLLEMGHKVIGYDPECMEANLLTNNGAISCFPTPEEFFEAKKDAVVIATPTDGHYAQIYMYREPLLVEKPIGHSWQALKEIKECLGQERGPVMVGNNLRFHGCVQKAKRFLLEIGQPLWANFTVAQYNTKPQYLRDGVTLNWGAHEMDLALYLLGPAVVVGASINKEDTISQILLVHENGCRTMLHFDYLAREEIKTFMIQGEDNLMACNLVLGQIMDLKAQGPFVWDRDFDETYILEMKAFLNGDNSIAASGEDGLQCLKLLLDAKKMGGL